jgi:hypothetical protein
MTDLHGKVNLCPSVNVALLGINMTEIRSAQQLLEKVFIPNFEKVCIEGLTTWLRTDRWKNMASI